MKRSGRTVKPGTLAAGSTYDVGKDGGYRLPMKLKKILIISGVVLVAAGVTTFTIVRAQSGYTKVLTAKVARENLVSIVSGTGHIQPKTYVNIGATSFG